MNDYLKIKELYHFGIKGQKWGVRRFQNEDGSLTSEGQKRYEDLLKEEYSVGKEFDEKVSKCTDVWIKSEARNKLIIEEGIQYYKKYPGEYKTVEESIDMIRNWWDTDDGDQIMLSWDFDQMQTLVNDKEFDKLVDDLKPTLYKYDKISDELNQIEQKISLEKEKNEKYWKNIGKIILGALGTYTIAGILAVGISSTIGNKLKIKHSLYHKEQIKKITKEQYETAISKVEEIINKFGKEDFELWVKNMIAKEPMN
jgi:hypothetical protein